MAMFSNKFTVEAGPEIGRIIFLDERAKIADGLPPSVSTAAEVVMSRENLAALARLIVDLLGRAES